MRSEDGAADALEERLNLSPVQRDARRDMGGALGLVVALWSLAALGALAIGEGMGVRFLDMPLCALLAGQGALMAAVLLSVSVPAWIDSVSRR